MTCIVSILYVICVTNAMLEQIFTEPDIPLLVWFSTLVLQILVLLKSGESIEKGSIKIVKIFIKKKKITKTKQKTKVRGFSKKVVSLLK